LLNKLRLSDIAVIFEGDGADGSGSPK